MFGIGKVSIGQRPPSSEGPETRGIEPKSTVRSMGLAVDEQRRGGATSRVASGAPVDITRKVVAHQPDRSLFI